MSNKNVLLVWIQWWYYITYQSFLLSLNTYMSIYVWCVLFSSFFLDEQEKDSYYSYSHSSSRGNNLSHFLQSIKQTLLYEHHKAYMWENFEIWIEISEAKSYTKTQRRVDWSEIPYSESARLIHQSKRKGFEISKGQGWKCA